MVHRAKERLRRADAPLERPDPAVHGRIVERLRVALEAQDRAGLLQLFSDAPQLISDVPLHAPPTPFPTVNSSLRAHAPTPKTEAQRASEPMPGPNWMGAITSLAQQASYAEVVSMAGAVCIALFSDGDVIGLIDVVTDGTTDLSARIVSLRILTSAAHLQAANQMLGRDAVKELLSRLKDHPGASVTVSRDFPVDVDA
jgi:RNA polymerase sigma-70 factor (ECF subfamily)